MVTVQDALGLLGIVAKDKVTQTQGVITSVCFDLYGCIQVLLTPRVKKDGSRADSYWYDLSRLITTEVRVMDLPIFELTKGPENKPNPSLIFGSRDNE